MVQAFEDTSRFISNISDQVNITFKTLDEFIDTIVTFFVNAGYWTSVLTFILLFLLLVSLPIIIIKYWDNIRTEYQKWTNKVVSYIYKE